MPFLNFSQTKELLFKYNIQILEAKLAKTKKEGLNFAKTIGYPVVLKISSPNITHKTDVNGVRIGIENKKELEKSWNEILSSVKKVKPKAKIDGILIQKQMKGKEIVVGMKRDSTFGPVLMVGIGGIFIEVLKDVAFRVCPVSKREARKMLEELKGYKLLKGHRNQKQVSIEKITETITILSKLSLLEKEIKEIDFNPIIANGKEALVVDARFLV
ncbi:MAG: acetate--CoA ligase family protein [Patescibacteria group bacterium]|nr:acetate--CoA ligase family protein [Patescibacteria group bacterium]